MDAREGLTLSCFRHGKFLKLLKPMSAAADADVVAAANLDADSI
jgi:hypothetical protein